MHAVIRTGGKQYRVAAGAVVKVELLAGETGETVTFDEVLMVSDGEQTLVGAPLIDDAVVTGTVAEQAAVKNPGVQEEAPEASSSPQRAPPAPDRRSDHGHQPSRRTERCRIGRQRVAIGSVLPDVPPPDGESTDPSATNAQ